MTVRAGSESWKAWFFGSLDPGSFITVDKPPLSLWLMGISARVLGFSSFAILLPQALCTIGAVGALFATVRRVMGPQAGLIAAGALAITPITVAIARVNNPDALLVALLVVSAYLLVRALESGRTTHLVLCGVVVGLAFMTKMLQGWMVVPALAAAYLLAGPPALPTRVKQLAIAGVAMVAASAAWPVAVSLWPGSAPYIGGSEDGSVWNLILGYNGFGRLTGAEGGMGGGGGSLSSEAISYLQAHQGSATYLLAAVGSQTTSQIIIDTGEPVVTIGGFTGQDPAPTVSRLAKLVADGDLKYVLISDSSGGGPGGGGSSDITAWVKAHGTVVDEVSVGSGTLYAVS